MIINSVVSGKVIDVKTSLKGKRYAVIYDGNSSFNVFESKDCPISFKVGDVVEVPVQIISDRPFFQLRVAAS